MYSSGIIISQQNMQLLKACYNLEHDVLMNDVVSFIASIVVMHNTAIQWPQLVNDSMCVYLDVDCIQYIFQFYEDSIVFVYDYCTDTAERDKSIAVTFYPVLQ